MIDAPTTTLLQNVLRREILALAQYVRDASPWTSVVDEESLGKLQQALTEDAHALAELGQFLARKRISPPYIGSYPMRFTSMNFITLAHLVPLLVAEQRREVATLEQEVVRVSEPAARAALEKVLDLKRRNLPVLEALASSHPEPAGR